MARSGIGARVALVGWAAVTLLLASASAHGAPPAPSPEEAVEASSEVSIAPPSTSESTPPGGETAAMRESLALLASRLEDVAGGSTPPPWAVALKAEIDARIERLMQMQERLAARIETPLPRLDEPIILLTVAASTLILGFVVGRGLQRRRDRRDGRFRL